MSAGVAAIVCVAARPRWFGVILLLCALLGVARFQQSEGWRYEDTLRELRGRTIILIGTIDGDVDRRIDQQRFILRASSAEVDMTEVGVRGRVLVTMPLYPTIRAGEILNIRCTLREPGMVDSFDYDAYLARYRVYSLCSRPSVLRHEQSEMRLTGTLYRAKTWMTERLSAFLPEPQAALAAGVLLGMKSGFSDATQDVFRRAGISHIVVLSGYNITVLAAAVLLVVIRAGGHRRHAYWVALGVLAVFVVMTGAAPSVIRAAMMGACMLTAHYVGRGSRMWYALIFAATAMVAANPRILLYDVSFQLSFLATVGLAVFAAPLGARLSFLPRRFGFRDALASTLAATIMTTPLIAFQFGRLSTVSPLANLFILPFIPLIMGLSALALLPGVGIAGAAIAWPLLTWVVACAEFFARLSWSSITIPHAPPWAAGAVYGIGALISFAWRKKCRSTIRNTV
jgi:competence protein ComEC